MTSSPDPRTVPAGIWECVALGDDDFPVWVALLRTTDGQDGPQVVLPEAEARQRIGDDAMTIARLGPLGEVVSVAVLTQAVSRAPEMWFAELVEDAAPRALHLMAFSGFGVEPWSVLDATAQSRLEGVSNDDQLGAIRWYPDTGEIDQIYVAPAWRRHGIATALMGAAATYNRAIGKPLSWGDGQRTAEGEKWRNGIKWTHRTAGLTNLAPPMTPYDER